MGYGCGISPPYPGYHGGCGSKGYNRRDMGFAPGDLGGYLETFDTAASKFRTTAFAQFDHSNNGYLYNTVGTGYDDPAANDGQTAIALVMFTGGTQGRADIYRWGDVNDSNIRLYHYRTGGTVYKFQVDTDQNLAGRVAQTGNYDPGTVDGTWVMVVGRVDNANNRLRVEVYNTSGTQFLDSGWVANASVDGTYDDDGTTQRSYIGVRTDFTDFPLLSVQNVVCWNNVLSDAQIASLVNSGAYYTIDDALAIGSPVHAYRLDEATGAATDEGSNAKDMTRIGSMSTIPSGGPVSQAPNDRGVVKSWVGNEGLKTLLPEDDALDIVWREDPFGIGVPGVEFTSGTNSLQVAHTYADTTKYAAALIWERSSTAYTFGQTVNFGYGNNNGEAMDTHSSLVARWSEENMTGGWVAGVPNVSVVSGESAVDGLWNHNGNAGTLSTPPGGTNGGIIIGERGSGSFGFIGYIGPLVWIDGKITAAEAAQLADYLNDTYAVGAY